MKKISDIFKTGARTYSFEFYPPKDQLSAVDFGFNVGKLAALTPSFVSVTYGAGGSNRDNMFALVDYLQNKIGVCTMAHYSCVGTSKDRIREDLQSLYNMGIRNLMLLRGDPQKGSDHFQVHPEGFAHASDLIAYARECFQDQFCIGGGAYPEVHPEAVSLDADLKWLKTKVDAGCDFLVTQLFFDNTKYFDFVRRARAAGITCRIIPGIIPVTQPGQPERYTKFSNASVPPELHDRLETFAGEPAKAYQAGMDFAINQCRDLLMMGAPGLHFYTLNKSRATVDIYETLLRG